MTPTGRRLGFPRHLGSRTTMCLIFGIGLSLGWPSTSLAARFNRFLTARDVADRSVLDQNGQPIQLPTAGDRHPALAKGSTPTYLAIPLLGGEHLPASIPTLVTGTQQGANPVGPLSFDALVQANLDTTLEKSSLAVVDTPSQNYLVEFLPRRKHATSISTSTVNELSHLFNTGTSQLTKLTSGSMTDLEKFLHISSKSSSSTPILNLQAQVLSGDALPPPIPEPSTWIIFAMLLVGGVVLNRRMPARLSTTVG